MKPLNMFYYLGLVILLQQNFCEGRGTKIHAKLPSAKTKSKTFSKTMRGRRPLSGPAVHDLDDLDLDESQTGQGTRIIRSSHFAQTYRLGYKILLVCVAEGMPLPRIRWFKDGTELKLKMNTHIYEEKIAENVMKTKIEIDPATVGDQGLYWCVANNRFAADMKSFKTAYEL